jgi:hypothetical protein
VENPVDNLLLGLAGALGVVAAIIHERLGQTKIIDRATFPHPTSRALVKAIWTFSSVTWIAASLVIATSPLWAEGDTLRIVVAAACAPIAWCAAANAVVTRGRHFGWMVLAGVVVLAGAGAALS